MVIAGWLCGYYKDSMGEACRWSHTDSEMELQNLCNKEVPNWLAKDTGGMYKNETQGLSSIIDGLDKTAKTRTLSR